MTNVPDYECVFSNAKEDDVSVWKDWRHPDAHSVSLNGGLREIRDTVYGGQNCDRNFEGSARIIFGYVEEDVLDFFERGLGIADFHAR